MTRLPMALCAAVAQLLSGSHVELEALFKRAGAADPPPELSHNSKWKEWLFRDGQDPNVDGLALMGILIEEFMDLPPLPGGPPLVSEIFDENYDPVVEYNQKRERIMQILEQHGLRYFPGGRILPNGDFPSDPPSTNQTTPPQNPSTVEELIQRLIRGLPRAMHPLTYRRKGLQALAFTSEYDIQDLLHSQLRPWVADIRPEEFTPSYAGSSTRMDFLLPAYKLVLEVKNVRDKKHATKVGDELIIDIEHYRRHPECDCLWCVIYDPLQLITNPSGLVNDLEGPRSTPDASVKVRVFVFGG